MKMKFSRRDFLKLGLASLSGLALRPISKYKFNFDPGAGGKIARVTTRSLSVYKEPSDSSAIVYQRFMDDIVNVYYDVISDDGPTYNPVWHRVWGGYMHSAHMVEVQNKLNSVRYDFPENGLLTEISVPYSQSYRKDHYLGWVPHYRLYFGSTHWVRDVIEGPDGTPWYKIEDEMDVHYIYYVPAPHLRPIPDSELTPISPDVPAELKRIEISIAQQTLTAYEENEIVMQTIIASGVPRQSIPGQISTDTPKGDDFHISSKMPSKHMGNGIFIAEKKDAQGLPIYDYEIPGVPWSTFFEPFTGVAIHGTYWHTNFGTPMSHGCVNMVSEEAKWIFRWTTPIWEPGIWEARGYGTRVIVA